MPSSLTIGELGYRLADREQIPRTVKLEENRHPAVFKLEHLRPSVVANMLGECLVRHSTVPILFAETRVLDKERVHRFFGVAVRERQQADECASPG